MERLKNLLLQKTGPLTDELELAPSAMGSLPKGLLPDQVARVVCGYCSTGCSLDVHIKKGQPVNRQRDQPKESTAGHGKRLLSQRHA